MKVELSKNDLENAVKCYLSKNGLDLTGKSVDVKAIAGRGKDGTRVEVTIDDNSDIGQVKIIPKEDEQLFSSDD